MNKEKKIYIVTISTEGLEKFLAEIEALASEVTVPAKGAEEE